MNAPNPLHITRSIIQHSAEGSKIVATFDAKGDSPEFDEIFDSIETVMEDTGHNDTGYISSISPEDMGDNSSVAKFIDSVGRRAIAVKVRTFRGDGVVCFHYRYAGSTGPIVSAGICTPGFEENLECLNSLLKTGSYKNRTVIR